MSHVYFIYSSVSKAIKIGWANDVSKRQRTLQTASGTKLYLLYACEVEDAHTEEKRLHAQFSRYRLEGEWFEASQELLNAIGRLRNSPIDEHELQPIPGSPKNQCSLAPRIVYQPRWSNDLRPSDLLNLFNWNEVINEWNDNIPRTTGSSLTRLTKECVKFGLIDAVVWQEGWALWPKEYRNESAQKWFECGTIEENRQTIGIGLTAELLYKAPSENDRLSVFFLAFQHQLRKNLPKHWRGRSWRHLGCLEYQALNFSDYTKKISTWRPQMRPLPHFDIEHVAAPVEEHILRQCLSHLASELYFNYDLVYIKQRSEGETDCHMVSLNRQ